MRFEYFYKLHLRYDYFFERVEKKKGEVIGGVPPKVRKGGKY
jgi:hypothetical protein